LDADDVADALASIARTPALSYRGRNPDGSARFVDRGIRSGATVNRYPRRTGGAVHLGPAQTPDAARLELACARRAPRA